VNQPTRPHVPVNRPCKRREARLESSQRRALARAAVWSAAMPTALSLLGSACGSTDETPRDFASVSMRLTLDGDAPQEADLPGVVASESGGDELHVNAALAFVRHIEFDLPSSVECDDRGDAGSHCSEDKLRVDGPWIVDLMTGNATPSMDDIQIPAGTYERVDVRFDDADPSHTANLNIPPTLRGNTLHASGSYIGDAADTFDLQLHFNEDARFEANGGIELTSDGTQAVLLRLDVRRWFRDIDVSRCASDGKLEVENGNLHLDDQGGDCSDVENDLKDSIKNSGRLDRN